MNKFRYVPAKQLNASHLKKPLKLLLKNGQSVYGTIKEVKSNGIIFIPATKPTAGGKQAHSSFFCCVPFVPIFVPIFFFFPFFLI